MGAETVFVPEQEWTRATDIESWIVRKFAVLVEKHGFSDPVISDRVNCNLTSIGFIGDEIGIEIEIDWDHRDVFVLAVRLSYGELRESYYEQNGRAYCNTVRTIAIPERWDAESTSIERTRIRAKRIAKRKRNARSTLLSVLEGILAERDVMLAHLPELRELLTSPPGASTRPRARRASARSSIRPSLSA